MGLSRTISETDGDFSRKSPIFPTPVYFAAPLKGLRLELGNGSGGQKKLVWRGYRADEVWRYLQQCEYSVRQSTSHQAYSSYIGYPYAGASSSNCVALCTQLSLDAVQRIWGALFNQLHSRVPVCDRHLPTSLHRGQEPSSVSGPSVMPARLRGTHCRAISAKQSTLLLLESC